MNDLYQKEVFYFRIELESEYKLEVPAPQVWNQDVTITTQ